MTDLEKNNFTLLLQAAQHGDVDAENRPFDIIDDELRRIAAHLSRDRHEARATSLVNDAYVYLIRFAKVDDTFFGQLIFEA